jgi:hypothetical protein
MTGYYLSIGYISGYSFRGNRELAWVQLKTLALSLCSHPERITASVMEIEPKRLRNGARGLFADELDSFCKQYSIRDDATIKFVEGSDPYISMLASSGNGDRAREIKERVRRAFCRLLILEAHKLGIEVELKVA